MITRSVPIYAGLLFATVAIGLASRHYTAFLPALLSKNAGDILWATAVYFLFALVAPRALPAFLFASAFGIGALVEVFKLYDPAWLKAIRHTSAGGLVLGHSFSWSKLVCYVIGAAIAVLLDVRVRRLSGTSDRAKARRDRGSSV